MSEAAALLLPAPLRARAEATPAARPRPPSRRPPRRAARLRSLPAVAAYPFISPRLAPASRCHPYTARHFPCDERLASGSASVGGGGEAARASAGGGGGSASSP